MAYPPNNGDPFIDDAIPGDNTGTPVVAAHMNDIVAGVDARALTSHLHAHTDIVATGTPSGTTYLRGDGSWSPASGGGGGSAVVTEYDPSGKTAAENRDDLNALLGVPGTWVRLPATGIVDVDEDSLGSNQYACLQMADNTALEIPPACTLRWAGTKGILGGVHMVVTNTDRGGGNENIHIFGGGTIDGNAGTTGWNDTVSGKSEIQGGTDFERVHGLLIENLTVKNCYGINGGTGENFLVQNARCYDLTFRNVRVLKESGHRSATGFHAQHCVNTVFDACTVDDVEVQGFGLWGGRGVSFVGCRASGNKRGFNFECTWDVSMVGCLAGTIGGSNPRGGDAGGVIGDREIIGNTEAGFNAKFQVNGNDAIGGGNYQITDCVFGGAVNSPGRGASLDSAGIVPINSTTSNTVTFTGAEADLSNDNIVGGLAQVVPSGAKGASDRPLLEVVSTSGGTVTLSGNHGGSGGDDFIYYPPRLIFKNCLFTDNYRGVEIFGGSSPYLEGIPTSRTLHFQDCIFFANSNTDIEGVASSDSTKGRIVGVRRGQDVTSEVDWVSGQAMLNPLPLDLIAHVAAAASVEVGDKLADPAALMAIPTAGGAGATAKLNETGPTPGTSLWDIPELELTLDTMGLTGRQFVIEGQILYTGYPAGDAQWQVAFTADQAAQMNMQVEWTGIALDLSGWDHDADYQAPGSQTEIASAVFQSGAGPTGSDRHLVSFKARLFVPGGRSGTFVVRAAEVNTDSGVRVGDGSVLTGVGANGGSVVGTGGGAGQSVHVPAGAWVNIAAADVEWAIA